MVFSDELYDKAFAFKKMKKWRRLGQNFIIAIDTLKQGCWYAMPFLDVQKRTTGFLLEGGQAGLRWVLDLADQEHQEHLNTYEHIVQGRYHEEYIINFTSLSSLMGWPDLEAIQEYCQKKDMVARGKNFYPVFRHVRPKYVPWFLMERKESLLCEKALEALMAMDNLLGRQLTEADGAWQHICHAGYKGTIPVLKEQKDGAWQLSRMEIDGHYEPEWPVAKLNDLDIARLKRVKKNADVWLVDKFIYNDVMYPEDLLLKPDDPPLKGHRLPGYYPDGVVMMNDSQGDVLVMNRVSFQLESYTPLAQMLKDAFNKCGRPRQFMVCRQESYDFFQDVCKDLGIELTMAEELTDLLCIRQDCIDGYDGSGEFDLDLDEFAMEQRFSQEEQRKKQLLQFEHFTHGLADDGVITGGMIIVYMAMSWHKEDIALLTMAELEEVVNMCLLMPVTKEAMDYVFGELRRRTRTDEIGAVVLIPGSNRRRK